MSRRPRSRAVSFALCYVLLASLASPLPVAGAVATPPAPQGAYARLAAERSAPFRAPALKREPQRVIVEWAAGVPAEQRAAAADKLGFRVVRESGALGRALLEPMAGGTPSSLASALKRAGLARTADVERVYTTAASLPNDPLFAQQWGLDNTGQTGGTPDADIDAPEAWTRGTGSDAVIVAVVDTGVDIEHPDLAGRIWTNTGEIPGNLADDDGNGYTDDVHGFDFYTYDDTVYDESDGDQHGTHVAGIVGAAGDDGVGISGVCQDVTIMPVKFLGPWGGGDFEAAEALRYAVDNGADVINCSWGGGPSDIIGEALDYAASRGVLVVCAAGNWGIDVDADPEWLSYPVGHDSTNVVGVAATDHDDELAEWSNRGVVSVDLAAPGVEITSTLPVETSALFVDRAPYKISLLGMAVEALQPTSTREAIVERSMEALAPQSWDVLVVDDSSASVTGEAPGARLATWTADIAAAGYGSVSTWDVDALGTPSADDLHGNLVVWFTGADALGWFDEPVLDEDEREVIGAFLDDGGRLLLSSGEAVAELSLYGVDPEWCEEYFHAFGVNYETYSYGFAGEGILDGLAARLPSRYAEWLEWPWPCGADALMPADRYATPMGGFGGYGPLSGTSMAAPHVTGAAALLMSQMPGASAEEIKTRLEGGVDALPGLDGEVGSGGRLNVDQAAGPIVGRPIVTSPATGDQLAASSQVPVRWRSPLGSEPGATFTAEYGLPYAVEERDFEGGTLAGFSTPPGAVSWVVTDTAHGGSFAARSGPVTASAGIDATSALQLDVTVPAGGGALSFWYWWDADWWFTWAVVEVDGEWQWAAWDLTTDWQHVELPLTAGPHTVRFLFLEYETDTSEGRDGFGIDDVRLEAHAYSPIGSAPAGATEMTWTVPVADTADARVRVRSQLDGETSAWSYVRGIGIRSDVAAPGPPTLLAAVPGADGDAALTWTDPADADFDHTRVLRRVGTPPTGAEDASATVVYEGSAAAATDRGMGNGDVAHYAAFAYDGAGNVSVAATASTIIVDSTPPGPVRELAAKMDEGVPLVQWMNPRPGSYQAVRVLRRTGAEVAGPDDAAAVEVYDGPAAFCQDYALATLATETVANYLAYAYDASGNRSTVATTSLVVDTRGPRGVMRIEDAEETDFGLMVVGSSATVTCDVVRATEMRFDIGAGWSAWEPFAGTKTLALWDIEGPQTVRAQFRDAGGVVIELSADVYVNLGPPSAPTSLTAEPIIGGVRLSWDESSGGDLEGYMVYMADAPAGPYEEVDFVPASGFDPFDPFGPSDFEDMWETALPDPSDPFDEDWPFPDWPGFDPRVSSEVRELEPGAEYWFRVTAEDAMFVSAPATISATAGEGVHRVAGDSRYSTAVEASKRHFDSADTVVLASGVRWPDALAASTLAGAYDGPVLLTQPGSVPGCVLDELERLGATQVIVVGGTASVSEAVTDQLQMDYAVRRIAGATRYATAAEIAKAAVLADPAAFSGEVFIASGRGFADALAAGPVAFSQGMPILLATADGLPPETIEAIDWLDADAAYILGGDGAVGPGAEEDLPFAMPTERIYGANRYETAAMLAMVAQYEGWADAGTIGIASGSNFPDGLAAGPAIGAEGGLLVLSTADMLPWESMDTIMYNANEITVIEMFGGQRALSVDVEADVMFGLGMGGWF